MSDVYIRQLRAIRDDLEIAREAFRFVGLNWHKQDVTDAFRMRTQPRVQQAAGNLERTYFVRLTAEFEGILKTHLQKNHPEIAFPAARREWTVDWFLSRVIQRKKIAVSPPLRLQLDEVRVQRNALAHGNPSSFDVPFNQALARYSTLLALLPDPRI